MRKPIVTALSLALLLTGVPVTVAAAPTAATTTQLPRTVVPSHYAIQVKPDAAAGTFTGSVVIDVKVVQATDTITLNGANLKIAKATWYVVNPLARVIPQHPQIQYDQRAQTITFKLASNAAPGNYQLALDYSGVINTQANGLFSLDYQGVDGPRRGLYTQFENSDARRFVPSWDEPSYKATFDLTATIPKGQMAISNMPITDRTDVPGGLESVTFATSPKMSTYLLFYGQGDFERATTMSGKTEIGVVTQRGKLSQAKDALHGSAVVLANYNDYFGIPFPLPKLDNVAAPGGSQFFSAMENWGAIFTFEHSLLQDPVVGTIAGKQSIFSIAAHEIAHQWFGNLVTMDWWDDLWLNEGFATWLASRETERVHPEWETALGRVARRNGSMYQDAFVTTHPVIQKITDVDQASQAFDGITYGKGGSVLKMLESYVGDEKWRKGVSNYLRAHAYGNAKSDDLWQSVQAAAGKPVTDIAHDFTLQPGIPMVKVVSATCVGGQTKLVLASGEYSMDQPDREPLRWRIPVSAQVVGKRTQWTVLSSATGTMTLPGCGTVQIDPGQTGYFRVDYAARIADQLKNDFARLQPIDQMGLLSNQQAMAAASYKPFADYGDLLFKVPANAHPAVWTDVASGLSNMRELFNGDTQTQARVDQLTRKVLASVWSRVGWDAKPNESDSTAILRSTLLRTLSRSGDSAIVAEARHRFADDIAGNKVLAGDAKSAVWGIVAATADAPTWEAIRAAQLKAQSPLAKREMYSYLAATQDRALAQRTLELALSNEVGETDAALLIAAVARNHPDLAFEFATRNVDKVNAVVDTTSRYRYFPRLISGTNDVAMADKLEAFGKAHIPEVAQGDMKAVAKSIRDRVKLVAARRPQVQEWLKANGY